MIPTCQDDILKFLDQSHDKMKALTVGSQPVRMRKDQNNCQLTIIADYDHDGFTVGTYTHDDMYVLVGHDQDDFRTAFMSESVRYVKNLIGVARCRSGPEDNCFYTRGMFSGQFFLLIHEICRGVARKFSGLG